MQVSWASNDEFGSDFKKNRAEVGEGGFWFFYSYASDSIQIIYT